MLNNVNNIIYVQEATNKLKGDFLMKNIKKNIRRKEWMEPNTNIHMKKRIIKIRSICTFVFLALLLLGKTVSKSPEHDLYQYKIVTVDSNETVEKSFNLKSSLLISIGLGASASIVHTNNKKVQKDS